MAALSFVFLLSLIALPFSSQQELPPPPNSPPDCSSAIVSFLPCLAFVQNNGTSPPSDCCSGVSTTLQSSPICLCGLLSAASNRANNINMSRALQLPSACNVEAHSIDGCSASEPALPPTPSIAMPPAASASSPAFVAIVSPSVAPVGTPLSISSPAPASTISNPFSPPAPVSPPAANPVTSEFSGSPSPAPSDIGGAASRFSTFATLCMAKSIAIMVLHLKYL